MTVKKKKIYLQSDIAIIFDVSKQSVSKKAKKLYKEGYIKDRYAIKEEELQYFEVDPENKERQKTADVDSEQEEDTNNQKINFRKKLDEVKYKREKLKLDAEEGILINKSEAYAAVGDLVAALKDFTLKIENNLINHYVNEKLRDKARGVMAGRIKEFQKKLEEQEKCYQQNVK